MSWAAFAGSLTVCCIRFMPVYMVCSPLPCYRFCIRLGALSPPPLHSACTSASHGKITSQLGHVILFCAALAHVLQGKVPLAELKIHIQVMRELTMLQITMNHISLFTSQFMMHSLLYLSWCLQSSTRVRNSSKVGT